jgi:hypothetical protein
MAKKILTEEEQIVKDIVDGLTAEIESNQERIFRLMSIRLGKEINAYNFNGIFGSKNNTYVDSVRSQFLDFDSFFTSWMKGLNDTFEEEKRIFLMYNPKMDWTYKSSFRMVNLLKNNEIYEQVKIFLERNYYKHLDQRMRMKPDESLWSIWFGYKLVYGVVIAPVKRAGNWTNDKSEIRKVNYNYWTVGHILNTGFIDPTLDEPIRFSNVDEFYNFYLSVIKRLSSSTYEQDIYDLYIDYLKNSLDVENEPLLIPEFRYKGLVKDHEHRLDLTILNQHTSEFLGFEISPASSHMSVAKLKDKQNAVNLELKVKWEKEMSKRNKYFENLGITTLTFTDIDLANIPACFDKIKEKLSNRPTAKLTLQSQLDRLNSY